MQKLGFEIVREREHVSMARNQVRRKKQSDRKREKSLLVAHRLSSGAGGTGQSTKAKFSSASRFTRRALAKLFVGCILKS